MSLSDDQKLFIRQNYRKSSSRQLAKKLGLSRPQIEDFIITLSSEQAIASRIVPKLPVLLLAGILLGLIFLTYSRGLGFGFVWDDVIQIVKNPLIKDFSIKGMIEIFRWPVGVIPDNPEHISFSYRPIQVLSYWVDYRLWGANPAAFHAMNILFQAGAAIILFFLLTKLVKNKELAFWASVIFAVHPVQIAAVTYISGRAESLAAIAMFSSFFFFYKSLDEIVFKNFLFLLISSFFYLSAILTKELSMILPILFLIYVKIFRNVDQKKISPLVYPVYLSAIGIALWMRISVLGSLGQGGIGELSMHDRSLGALMSLLHYLRLLFFPHSLHLAYQLPQPHPGSPDVIIGAIILAVLLVLTWNSKKNPTHFFCWLWFWVFLIPIMDILVLMNGPMAEHWLYNALIGFFLVLGGTLFWLVDEKMSWAQKGLEPFLILAVLGFSLTTYHSSRVWKNEITVFENIIKYTHYDPDIYSSLGSAYAKDKQWDEAERSYRKALELDPNFEHAHRGLQAVAHHRMTERMGVEPRAET